MSTKDRVYELRKELAFWQRVHENEPMDEREFKLERQINQLENCNEFGVPQYNGHVDDDDDDDDTGNDQHIPMVISCRYCKEIGLKWIQVNGKWRLAGPNGLHVCKEYLGESMKGLSEPVAIKYPIKHLCCPQCMSSDLHRRNLEGVKLRLACSSCNINFEITNPSYLVSQNGKRDEK